jgi:hypothetical protein
VHAKKVYFYNLNQKTAQANILKFYPARPNPEFTFSYVFRNVQRPHFLLSSQHKPTYLQSSLTTVSLIYT